MNKIITIIACSLFILSCATKVSVNKVTRENVKSVHGIKYSLPKAYIEFKPSEEGGGEYAVDVIYLPDIDQTYAINASTFLGTLNTEVKIENGLLTQVDLGGASDAVAAEAVKAAGAVISEDLKRKQTEKDENQKQIKALEDDVDGKRLALEKAQKKYDLDPTKENKIALELAGLDLAEAVRKLADAKGNLNQAANKLDFANQSAPEVPANMVWGPMYYEIIDTYDVYQQSGEVRLVAKEWPDGETQQKFATIRIISGQQSASSTKLNCSASGVKSFTSRDGLYQLADETQQIAFTQDIKEIDKDQSKIKPNGADIPPLPSNLLNLNLRPDKTTLEITIDDSVPAGTYDLNIVFAEKNDNPGTSTCIIELTRD